MLLRNPCEIKELTTEFDKLFIITDQLRVNFVGYVVQNLTIKWIIIRDNEVETVSIDTFSKNVFSKGKESYKFGADIEGN